MADEHKCSGDTNCCAISSPADVQVYAPIAPKIVATIPSPTRVLIAIISVKTFKAHKIADLDS